MINKNFYPKRINNVKQRDLDDGCVLLDQNENMIYTLNLTSAYVWELCDGNHSINEIIEDLIKISSYEKEDIKNDVYSIISNFLERKLIYNFSKSEV